MTMKKKEKTYVLYMHTRKSDGRIFYIGIGSKKRSKDRSKRSDEWKEIYREHGRVVKILAEGLTAERAKELEILMIAFYGRIKPNPKKLNYGCLVNKTDGGEGTNGYEKTEEQKEHHKSLWTEEKKLEKSLEQKLLWSDEDKRKEYSERFSGEGNPMFGVNWFEIWIEKYGEEVANQMLVDLKLEQSKQRTGENNGRYGKSNVDCWAEKYGEEVAKQMWEDQKPKHSVKNKWIKEFGEEIGNQMWENQKKHFASKGSDNAAAKVTEDDVRWMRKNYIPNHDIYGGVAMREKFGLGRSAFHSIISGKTWKHIL